MESRLAEREIDRDEDEILFVEGSGGAATQNTSEQQQLSKCTLSPEQNIRRLVVSSSASLYPRCGSAGPQTRPAAAVVVVTTTAPL